MAAQVMAEAGHRVTIYEQMPSLGRKFLLAGRGGLNLTHAEPFEQFMERYGPHLAPQIAKAIERFTPQDTVRWCEALGQPTFIGSSKRVFPVAMKASGLLRAWLRHLTTLNVTAETRVRWCGLEPLVGAPNGGSGACADSEVGGGAQHDRSRLALARISQAHLSQPRLPVGPRAMAGGAAEATVFTRDVDAVVLALGGASWPRLGSDGQWQDEVRALGADVSALRPSNCGVEVAWRDVMRERFAGQPIKSVAVSVGARDGEGHRHRGEMVITRQGLEGGAIYAAGAEIRAALDEAASAPVLIRLDLAPDLTPERIVERLGKANAKQSLANRLRRAAGLSSGAAALVREATLAGWDGAAPVDLQSNARLAGRIKATPVALTGLTGLERAISTAGGVRVDALDERLMLRERPGVFFAGEMLDWDAPTGGYLLQATLASGRLAGEGVVRWLDAVRR